jgi:hypothetical protein
MVCKVILNLYVLSFELQNKPEFHTTLSGKISAEKFVEVVIPELVVILRAQRGSSPYSHSSETILYSIPFFF